MIPSQSQHLGISVAGLPAIFVGRCASLKRPGRGDIYAISKERYTTGFLYPKGRHIGNDGLLNLHKDACFLFVFVCWIDLVGFLGLVVGCLMLHAVLFQLVF